MFCNKCGKKLVAGDVFCPGCGARIVWEREEAPAEEMTFDVEKPVQKKETFNFNWDLDDFNRNRSHDETIEWGDLFGLDERRENRQETRKPVKRERPPVSDFMFDNLIAEEKEEAKPAGMVKQQVSDFLFDQPVPEAKSRPSADDRFKTFNQKNQEFQDLLERERVRLGREKEEESAIFENIQASELNRVIELDETPEFDKPLFDVLDELPEVPEEEPAAEELTIEQPKAAVASDREDRLSFFEKRRKKKEEKLSAVAAPDEAKPAEPLRLDEDDLSGQWPPEGEQVPEEEPEKEVEKEAEPEEKKPVNQIDEMAEARSRLFNTPIEQMVADDAAASEDDDVKTMQINREDFADFLKDIEKQFGIDAMDEEIEEEAVEEETAEEIVFEVPEEEIEPEAEETEAEEPVVIEEKNIDEAEEVKPVPEAVKNKKKVKEETGEFKLGDFGDDNFWGDAADLSEDEVNELKKESKKGSGAGTAVIIILSVILAAQLGIMLIRYQFPDSDIAQFIEPKLTMIENWIRGLF